MKKPIFLSKLIVLSLFYFFMGTNLRAQVKNLSTVADTADYPYWIQMMRDPNANFNATVSAFEKYWQNRSVAKSSGWKVFKRWQYITGKRLKPDGTRPSPDAVAKEYYKFQQQQRSPNGNWTSLGPGTIPSPGPPGYLGLGRLNVIAFHPTDPNKLYVGSPSGGFWMTSDHGSNWITTTDNMPTIGVSAIVVDFSNPLKILIGTGDRDAGDAPGMGVYASLDGGYTWSASKTGMNDVTVSKLLQNPQNSQIFLAATTSGIYRSTNGGANWTLTKAGTYLDICFKPGNPNVVYAEYSSNFYRSTDNGLTFTKISSGLTAGQRGAIAVTPANPEYVYFLQSNTSSRYKGVYRSTNGGTSFAARSTTPNILDYSCTGTGTSGQGWYDLSIAADPTNAEIIFVGGVNVFKSVNGGTNWTISSHWWGDCSVAEVHADCHFLGYSPVSGKLYACNDGGTYVSSNSGTTWTDFTVGMTIGQIYKIGQCQTDGSKTINGFQDNGTYTNTSSGWVATGGGDGMECAFDYLDPAYAYYTIYYGTIYRTYNSGSEFELAGEGINGITEAGDWVTPFLLSKADPKVMFVGYLNVWRCNDVKSNTPVWTKISTGETVACSVIKQSPVNTNLIYVVRSGAMKRTENANSASPTWTSCVLPGGGTPTDLETHPTEPNTVYATASYKVYKSVDKGATWTLVSGTLPSIPVNTIVYDKNSSEGLYIGTQTGILYKNSSMTDWVNFSSGLPVVDVRELEIFYSSDPANNRLMAATFGRGLWKSELYTPPNPPVSNFSIGTTMPCTLETVQLTDLSLNLPTSWLWSFSPSTVTFVNATSATSQNPQVQFTENGTYTATLKASNAYGYTTSDQTIQIGGSVMPFSGTFESGAFPAGWVIQNPDSQITWTITPAGGTPSGNKSAVINFYDYNAPGQLDDMILPTVNLKDALNPWLKFRVAYRTRGAGNSDGLKIFVSTNCSSSWETNAIYDKSGTDLATGPGQDDAFIPSVTSDWRLDSVDLKAYAGMTVRLKFRAVCGWGNNLYLDDIAVADDPLLTIQNTTVTNGQQTCYNASQTIKVAGSGTQFVVQAGGIAKFFAGQNIIFLEGTIVNDQGYLLGNINGGDQYCGQSAPSMVSNTLTDISDNTPSGFSVLKLYPNPNNGNFTLEWSDPVTDGPYQIEIFGMFGERKMKEKITSGQKHSFSLLNLPRGIYLVRVSGIHGTGMLKMILQ